MKFFLILPLLCCFMTAGFAQKEVMAEKKSAQQTKCCTYVIDHVGPSGDLVSTVWEPLPTSARKCTQPVDIVVEHVIDKKRVNPDWKLCTLKECPSLVQIREGSQLARTNRKTINNKKFDDTTPVIDLAGFAPGEYVIRATACNNTYETTIRVPDGGNLARPEPKPVAPRKTK